jgi:V-ATPase subunit H
MNLMTSGKKMQGSSMTKITNNSSDFCIYLMHYWSDIFLSRTLIKVLKESSDPIVLAVAAHDVGQYVKHYERGKKSVFSLDVELR